MKSVIAVSVTCLLLVASAADAQTAPPKGATPAPTQPAPAQPAPAQPAAPAARPAPRPFPADAKVAYVDLNTVATTSKEGQAAGVKIKDLQAKRAAELEGKQKQLQAAQQKLEQGGAVLSESARALAEIEKDPELQCTEVQYLIDFIRQSKRGVILRRATRRPEDVSPDE